MPEKKYQDYIKNRVPSAEAPFKVSDIRGVIPAHCFEHSLLYSFGYLLKDLSIVLGVAFAVTSLDNLLASTVIHPAVNFFLRVILWLGYWAVNGCVMTGLWVLGHECGHGGFAASAMVNNVVGLVVHSALLVPFFSWAISHRRHHSNTGNIDKDEVFVPATRESYVEEIEDLNEGFMALISSLKRFFQIFIMMTLGWPLYLTINATGHQTYPKNTWINHFIPSSPIFAEKEKKLVIISDIGLLIAFYVIYRSILAYGFLYILKIYIMPLLVVNFFF